MIPLYAAGASLALLLIQLFLLFKALSNRPLASQSESGAQRAPVSTSHRCDSRNVFASYVARHGGVGILSFNIARMISCVSLVGLSAIPIIQDLSKGSHALLHITVCLTYLTARLPQIYASFLATISVFAKSGVAVVAIRHLDFVLLSVWGVYIYRDVWPLATFALSPLDAAEGVILWFQLADLTFAAVFVPLSIPRRYTPVDPKHPSSEPHPEQTASVLSRIVFAWLDKTVYKAYRVPHLPIEELPPLADYDQAHNLMQGSFKELDPFQVTKGRHVFWGLVKVFRE
ncbi:predicted protein [Postia placenta Mad-698-R]|nr:predicted protein [Postia placenta Mad-698-R]